MVGMSELVSRMGAAEQGLGRVAKGGARCRAVSGIGVGGQANLVNIFSTSDMSYPSVADRSGS